MSCPRPRSGSWWAAGLKPLRGLDPSQHPRYVTVRGAVALLPGLHLSGWYFDPLVQMGQDFEPPHHARVSLTFDSKFWRVYRSGIFELRAEAAMDSWSRGTAGVDSSGVRALPGARFGALENELGRAGGRWVEPPAGNGAVALDLGRARQVVAAARELKKRLKLKGEIDLAFVARQPDVLAVPSDGERVGGAAGQVWEAVAPLVERAAEQVLAMRGKEGRALAAARRRAPPPPGALATHLLPRHPHPTS